MRGGPYRWGLPLRRVVTVAAFSTRPGDDDRTKEGEWELIYVLMDGGKVSFPDLSDGTCNLASFRRKAKREVSYKPRIPALDAIRYEDYRRREGISQFRFSFHSGTARLNPERNGGFSPGNTSRVIEYPASFRCRQEKSG